MAINLERCVRGAVFYQRGSHRMGNTMLRTKAEWSVRIVEGYDSEKGYAVASWNSNAPKRHYAHELKKLYDWSMYDKDDAVVVRGLCDAIVKVTRRKKCPKYKQRHASEQCPAQEGP